MFRYRLLALGVLVVILLAGAALWTSTIAFGAVKPLPTPRAAVLETTVAVARSEAPPVQRYGRPSAGWSAPTGNPLALLVVGTMLLGLAAAVRRVE